jgi:short-subunit dehydrogenase
MNRWEKALIFGAAGALAYGLLSRRRAALSLRDYYRGKVIVVTGGANGIGLAIVSQLYQLDANVLAVDINADALDRLADKLPGVATLALDLGAKDAPERVLNETISRFGHADILFNNAGIIFEGPFLQMTDENIERLIGINLIMHIRMTRTFLPYLLGRGGGVIAYTGSMSAHVYPPLISVYAGTKGGLHNFVASLRRELPRDSKVQLTIIQPNVTRTNLSEKGLFDAAEKMMRLQTADEVALAFLRGIARGEKEIFVTPIDKFYKWGERLVPAYAEARLRKLAENNPNNIIVTLATK